MELKVASYLNKAIFIANNNQGIRHLISQLMPAGGAVEFGDSSNVHSRASTPLRVTPYRMMRSEKAMPKIYCKYGGGSWMHSAGWEVGSASVIDQSPTWSI